MYLLGFSRSSSGLSSFFALVSLIYFSLILSSPVSGQSAQPFKSTYYSLDEIAEPVDLIISAKRTFLVTTKGIYQQERKKFLKKYAATGVITCALEDDSVFWVGTQTGLVRVNKKSFKTNAVILPVNDEQPHITTILKDHAGTIWVGAEAYGVYQLVNKKFKKVLGAFPVNAGRSTPDSSVWIGTNTGLYRWKNKEWLRYNEEGVTNYEIPDNIVDRLLVDSNQNLWAVLSEGLTVFESHSSVETGHGHVPAIKFIGKPQNPVYSIAYVKQQGYLFATGMGLLFLPENTNEAGHVAHLEQTGASDVVQDQQRLHVIQADQSPSKAPTLATARLLRADKNNLWFVDKHGITVLPLKEFAKVLPVAKIKKM